MPRDMDVNIAFDASLITEALNVVVRDIEARQRRRRILRDAVLGLGVVLGLVAVVVVPSALILAYVR